MEVPSLSQNSVQEKAVLIQEALRLQFKGGTAEERQKAEKELDKAQFDANFVDIMLEAINIPNSTFSDKQAAAIQLKKNLGIMKVSQMIPDEVKQYYLARLFDVIINRNLAFNIIDILVECYSTMVSQDLTGISLDQIYPKIWENIKLLDTNKLYAGLSILVCYTINLDIESIPEAFFTETLLKLDELGATILPLSVQQLGSVGADDSIINTWIVLGMFFKAYKSILEIISKGDREDAINVFLKNEKLIEFMVTVLNMRFSQNRLDEKCVISYTVDSTQNTILDDNLNKLKAQIYSICIKIVKHCIEIGHQSVIAIEQSKYYDFINKAIEITIESLCKITSEKSKVIEQIYKIKNGQYLIYKKLQFLKECCNQNIFLKKFGDFNKDLLNCVCLPQAVSSDEEQIQMKDDPQEFINFSLDCVGKQKSKLAKSETAGLFENLCDNIDGFLTYAVNVLMQAFEILVTRPDVDFQAQMFPKANDLLNTTYWQIYSDEQKIESICLLLADIAYIFGDRRDLFGLFECRLSAMLHTLLSSNSKIISNRLQLLFGQYRDCLFLTPSYSEQFKNVMQFIMNALLLGNYSQVNGETNIKSQINQQANSGGLVNNEQEELMVIKLQAIETLNLYLNKDDLENCGNLHQKLKPFVGDITNLLVHVFTDNSDVKVVSTLRSILYSFPDVFTNSSEELIMFLLTKTVNKILSELENSKASNSPPFGNLNNYVSKANICCFECLSLIDELVDQGQIMAAFSPLIINELNKLFVLLKSKQEANYDPEVIKIAWKCLESTKIVNDVMVEFAEILLNNKFHLDCYDPPLFEFFNRLCLWGKDRFLEKPEIFNLFITKSTKEFPRHNGSRLLMIHSIIENFFEILTEEHWTLLQSKVVLAKDIKDPKAFIQNRRFGVVLITFIFYPVVALKIYSDLNMLDEILKTIIVKKTALTTSYDRKIFVMGMMNLQRQPELCDPVKIRVASIISSITEVLDMQSKKEGEERAQMKIKNEKANKKIFDSDSQDDSLIDDDDDDSEFNDYDDDDIFTLPETDNWNVYKTAIKEKDEYLLFKEFILQLRMQNITAFDGIMSKMTESAQQMLKSTIQKQRIAVSDEQDHTVPRKILKIKRKSKEQFFCEKTTRGSFL